MCGICGIVDFSGGPINRATLETMRDEMTRRGPDDAGLLLAPGVGLGHRRLSIIDLSPRGRQPMSTPDGEATIVYNGEIYNFQELREELERGGVRFVSGSDTEVLLHGFRRWGLSTLLERINGMFAFAIWEASSKRLHLARDRTGKKPLYYVSRGDRFAFASEIKALVRAGLTDRRVRREALARFLYWAWIPGEQTIFDDVQSLPPGCYMIVDANSERRPHRYWDVTFTNKLDLDLTEAMEQTDRVLGDAVRRRLYSDVPLGAFLSGGVDSAYVVSRMVEYAVPPVRTFSIGFDDDYHDERPHAEIVARHLQTRHTVRTVHADAWSLLSRLVWECGQPFGDAAIIPTSYVAQQARQQVTVALSGDGGDESFAGYSQHTGRAWGARLSRWIPGYVLRRLLTAARPLLDSGQRSMVASAARFLRYASRDPSIEWAAANTWGLHHLSALWSHEFRGLADSDMLIDYPRMRMRGFVGDDPLDRALYLDLHVQLPFAYNVKVDVATMYHSLEARCPFLDREVIEWAARLPIRYKLHRGERKWLLKRLAARRVPREVVYRPKHGFSSPLDAWFRGGWARAAQRVVFSPEARQRGYFNFGYLEKLWDEHQAGRAAHGLRFWLLLWLEMWHLMFVDGRLSPGDDPAPEVAKNEQPVSEALTIA
jgi:asparagine synthase (glutamine-hydrolysing)